MTLTVLAILAAAIMPIAKTAIQRDKELELRRALREIREAIDAYKKLADEKRIEIEEDSEGYPPDLETLVKGVEVQETAGAGEGERRAEASKKTRPLPAPDPQRPHDRDRPSGGFAPTRTTPTATSGARRTSTTSIRKSRAKALDGSTLQGLVRTAMTTGEDEPPPDSP